MPVSFDIACATGSYTVSIGAGLFEAELGETGDRLIIADQFLAGRLAAMGIDAITLVADENTKSLEQMVGLIEAIKGRRATRNTTLIAIGGGVVQDCVAFAATVYMRGLPWIYVPTTLLSMVDSCIGGKSSINVGAHKNIIGTFHPPRRILIDPALTQSLSVEQRSAGLCEAAKICLCRGATTFDDYLALESSATAGGDSYAAVIALCLQAKQWFIEIDEFDQKERLVLNFGHTFGHAIEAASGFAICHGIAVGLGMLAALQLGEQLGLTDMSDPLVLAFRDHVRGLVGQVDGLTEQLRAISFDKLMDAFLADKKHSHDKLALILVTNLGAVERILVPRSEEILEKIRNSFVHLEYAPVMA